MKFQALRSYFRDRQVSLARKSLVFWALAYGVMPFDLVNDFIPIVGWLDDVGVLGAVAAFVWRDVRKHSAVAALAPESPPR